MQGTERNGHSAGRGGPAHPNAEAREAIRGDAASPRRGQHTKRTASTPRLDAPLPLKPEEIGPQHHYRFVPGTTIADQRSAQVQPK